MLISKQVPIEILRVIVSYCPLSARAIMACLSKVHFPWTETDWRAHAHKYNIEPTLSALRSLISRDYRSQLNISRRLNHLWSEHLDMPLVVWSPWTIQRFSYIFPNKMLVLCFRHQRFINFVRGIALAHNLKIGRLIRRYAGDECVKCCLSILKTKRIEMVINKRNQRLKRYCIKNIKSKKNVNGNSHLSYSKTRAFLEFYVSSDRLMLKIRKLEFVH